MSFKSLFAASVLIVTVTPSLAFELPEGKCTFTTYPGQCGQFTVKHAGRNGAGQMNYRLSYVAGACNKGKITQVEYRGKKFNLSSDARTVTIDHIFNVRVHSLNIKKKWARISYKLYDKPGGRIIEEGRESGRCL